MLIRKFLKKVEVELPQDLDIPLLGLYWKDVITHYSHMHVLLLDRWWNSRCSTTDEWIRKMWYLYTMEYYSAINQ